MATLSLTIFKAKQLSDGRHKIRIAVRHHHETSYIITQYIIDDISQFKDGRVVKRYDADVINMQLRTLLNKYQKIVDVLQDVNGLSAKELKNTILSFRENDDNISIGKICSDYVNELREDQRFGYASLLEQCGKTFLEFSKGDIPARVITTTMINNFERFLRNNKKLNQTTVGMYLTRFRVLINLGRKRYSVNQKNNPFQDYKIPQPLIRELDISKEELKRLIKYIPQTKAEVVAKDLWLLSFYLGGINLIDILQINFSSKTEINYIREKTKNTKRSDKCIAISIPTEAVPIIEKYMQNNGMLCFGYNFTYKNFNRYIARTISNIGKKIGIKRLCYYSARKSFVQYGFELGIPLEILEYVIGQSMKQNRPIYNYIRIMREHADEAIRRIIDYSVKNIDTDTRN